MKNPEEIDAFSLCSSPFTAPGALVFFGLAKAAIASEVGFFTVLFWQALLAFEFAVVYLAISLPVAWLLWRTFPTFCSNQRSITAPLLIAVAAFSVSANSRAFGILLVGPLESEIFSIVVGVVLNAITFVWLHRRALTHHSTGPARKAAQASDSNVSHIG